MKKIIIFGPPGAGKGTISDIVSKKYKIPHIGVGDLLREHVAKGDELGKTIKDMMEGGNLLHDDLVNDVVKNRLSKDDAKTGFILDGYPRHIAQAEFLLGITNVEKVVVLEISEKDIMNRLAGRRVCPKCGASYHITNIPPKVEGICDKCGTKLTIRTDENKIKHRFEVYHKESEPVIKFFKEKGVNIKKIPGDIDLKTESDKIADLIMQA